MGNRATGEVRSLFDHHLRGCRDCRQMNRLLYAVYEGPAVPQAPAGTTPSAGPGLPALPALPAQGEEKEFHAILRRMRDEKPAPWYYTLTLRTGIGVLACSAAALALSLAGVTPASFGFTSDDASSASGVARADIGGTGGSFSGDSGERSSIRHAAQAYGRVVGGSAVMVDSDGDTSRSSTFEVGTRFEVDANESLQIGLLGKMVANATPGSKVTWVKGSASLVELQIDQGMLAVRYDRDASDPILQVRTPTAVIRVVGTVFTVQVEEGEGSAVSVLRGQVEILDPATNQTVAEVESGDRYDVAKGNYDTVGRLEVQSALPISMDAAAGDSLEARVPSSWHVPGLPTELRNRTLAYVPERSRTGVIEGPSIRVMGTGGASAHSSSPTTRAPEPLPIKPPARRVENDGDDIIADLMKGAAAARRKELIAALANCRDLYATNDTRYLAATCIGKFLGDYDDHPLAAEAYLLRGMLRMDYALDYKTAEMDLKTYLRRAPNGRQVEKAHYRLWLSATEDGRISLALNRARAYLDAYPNGRFVGKIIQRFPELKNSL
ncbi:MAG: FecR family protein [Nannocystaceae bacterium]|nr:FecR family protein [Nannocystaceae bacterium]